MKQFFINKATMRCFIGLLQGTLLWILFSTSQNKINWFAATDYFVFFPMLVVVFFVPLLIIQEIGNLRSKIILIQSFLTSLILIGLSYYAVYRQVLPNQYLSLSNVFNSLPELFFLTSIALFISQALILSSEHDKKLIANYSTYFDVTWKLAMQILFTLAFTGFVWVLLRLGSTLFDIIHLKFFGDMLSFFAFPITTLTIAISLHITDVNVRVTQGIRTLSLVLLSWLLPLFTAIISVFLLSLFFTGLTSLWQTGYASALLLLIAALLIILINATYQDGSYEKPLPSFQRYTAVLACYLLMPIMVITIFALYLRVQQYGWSVGRIYAAACMLIGVFYALGYTLASLINDSQLKLFKYCNVAAASLILIIYFALHTPLADPVRLTVANQLFRLQSGITPPEKFDFYALQHNGLRFGQQALQDLGRSWPRSKPRF